MPCKITSKGTKLYYDADGVDPYTQLAGVMSLSGPEVTKDFEEQTDLDATAGWKEFCVNFKDGGELSAQIFLAKAVVNVLHNTIFASDNAFYYRITFPLQTGESNPSKIEFAGFLVGIGNEVPEKGNVMVPIRIKVTGAVLWTSGS